MNRLEKVKCYVDENGFMRVRRDEMKTFTGLTDEENFAILESLKKMGYKIFYVKETEDVKRDWEDSVKVLAKPHTALDEIVKWAEEN